MRGDGSAADADQTIHVRVACDDGRTAEERDLDRGYLAVAQEMRLRVGESHRAALRANSGPVSKMHGLTEL